MTLRSFSLFPLLLLSPVLLRPLALAASDVPGKVNLYEDYNCFHASTLNPTVTLPLSTCLVTPGGYGLVIAAYPPCPSSSASLLFYQDASCGVQVKVTTSIGADKCFLLWDGFYDARSVMFTCQPAAANPQPSSTTTAIVSQLAAVATGSPTGNGNSQTTSAVGPEPTNTGTSGTTNSSPGNSSGTNNSNPGNSTSSSSGSGLSTSDIIALAVGLGVGGLTITIMLLAWLFPNFRHRLRSWMSSWLDHMAFRHDEQQQWGHGGTQEMRRWQPQPYQPYQHNPDQMAINLRTT